MSGAGWLSLLGLGKAKEPEPIRPELVPPGPAHRKERNQLRLQRLEQQIADLENAGAGGTKECIELKQERARTKMLLGDYSDVIK